MRLTIPTREVQPGDMIPALGVRVAINTDTALRGRILYFGPDDPSQCIGSVYLNPDTLVEVDRPDPDASLVERMAQAARAAYYGEGAGGDAVSSWDTMSKATRADWVNAARAALAVATQERGADE